MARIFKDSSVLNQFGSPSINSNTFANRPAAGQVGRLFVDTTNNIIQRDTGSGWVTVSGSGSTPNLQAVTGVGNTSSNGIFLGLTGNLANGLIFEVSGYTRMEQTVGSATNLGASNIKQFTFQTSGTTVATGNPSPNLNQLFVDIQVAQTVGGAGNLQIGAGLFENVLSGTDNLNLSITQTVGISALSPIISYQRYINTGDSNITHTAGIVINGLQNTGSGVLQVTNNYQLLINSSQQFASTSVVSNRWGIYQAGANDNNYLASALSIGVTVLNGQKLNVEGSGRFVTDLYIDNTAAGEQTLLTFGYSYGLRLKIGYVTSGSPVLQNNVQYGQIIFDDFGNFNIASRSNYPSGLIFYTTLTTSSGYAEAARFENTGSLLLGTTTNTNAVKLKVNGNVEITTTTVGGAHTPTTQHLPIYVNGFLYYLQLLN